MRDPRGSEKKKQEQQVRKEELGPQEWNNQDEKDATATATTMETMTARQQQQ